MRINNVCWLISARVCVLSYVLDEPCRSILYKLTHTHTNMHTISALPEDATIYNQLCNYISKNAASCARMKITTSGSLRALFCAFACQEKCAYIFGFKCCSGVHSHAIAFARPGDDGNDDEWAHQPTTPSTNNTISNSSGSSSGSTRAGNTLKRNTLTYTFNKTVSL